MQLQRITTSTRWIPEIDGLRFIAILSVLLIHVLADMMHHSPLAKLQAEGHPLALSEMYLLGRGVQLFFAISGFILAQPFLRQYADGGKPVLVRDFYLRRLTRLEPPYLLSLLVYAVVAVVVKHWSVAAAGSSWLGSAAYVQNVRAAHGGLPLLNLVTWSLEVEVEFYVLAPLLALLFRLRATAVRRGVLVALIAASACPPWTWANAHGWFLPDGVLLMGFLLADLRVHQRPEWTHPLWDGASLALWPLFFFLPPFRWTSPLLSVLLVGCFVAGFCGPLSRRALGVRWVALLGGMCYSIYLLHMVVIGAMLSLTHRLIVFPSLLANYAVQLALLLPVIFGVSLLYFVWVERPCMEPHWPSKLWSKWAAAREKKELPAVSR